MSIIEKQFKRFYRKILLTKRQRVDAQTKYSGVCKKLHGAYYESSYDGSTKLLFGSYGKKTNIRPPRDIDVIFKLPLEEFERYDSYVSNGQSALLQDIKEVLEEKYSVVDRIRAWGKVVRVEFSDSTHAVEVLPAIISEGGGFLIPNTENGGSWENFDPRSNIESISSLPEEKRKVVRKIVRMIKKWCEESNADIKSYETESLVVSFFNENPNLENSSTTLIMKGVFEYMLGMVSEEGAKSRIQTAIKRVDKAIGFEKENKLRESIEEWIKVFGTDFPLGIEKEIEAVELGLRMEGLQNIYPSSDEQFIDRDYGYPIDLDPNYEIKIDAKVDQNGWRVFSLSEALRGNFFLRKEKSLLFRVVKNTVPKPYTTFWKVRNYGEEAKSRGGLRGEISEDKGYDSKQERTLYEGDHYVECYCIKDNVCVASNKILVPIGNVK